MMEGVALMKKRGWIVHLSAVLVTAILIVFARDIAFTVTAQTSDMLRVKQEEVDALETISPTSCGVTWVRYLGGVRDKISVFGWAFSEGPAGMTTASNSPLGNKKVTVYLQNIQTGEWYRAPALIHHNGDLYERFRGSHNLLSPWVAFEVRFSSLNMKKGAYRLFAYVQEEGTPHGIAQSEQCILIETGNIAAGNVIPKENAWTVKEKTDIPWHVQDFAVTDRGFWINGWVVRSEKNADANFRIRLALPDGNAYEYGISITGDWPEVNSQYDLEDSVKTGFSGDYYLPQKLPDHVEIILLVQTSDVSTAVQETFLLSRAEGERFFVRD